MTVSPPYIGTSTAKLFWTTKRRRYWSDRRWIWYSLWYCLTTYFLYLCWRNYWWWFRVMLLWPSQNKIINLYMISGWFGCVGFVIIHRCRFKIDWYWLIWCEGWYIHRLIHWDYNSLGMTVPWTSSKRFSESCAKPSCTDWAFQLNKYISQNIMTTHKYNIHHWYSEL